MENLIQHSIRVNGDPRFSPGMNTLIDFTEAELNDDVEAVSRYVQHSRELADFRGACRWACVVSDESEADLIWTFNLVVQSRGIPIKTRAFYDEEEALRWLGEASVSAPKKD